MKLTALIPFSGRLARLIHALHRYASFAAILAGFLVATAGAATVPYTWGNNGNGALGNGTVGNSTLPVAVTASGDLAGKTIEAVATGVFHCVAVATDGTVYTWGDNTRGQLGNNSTTSISTPVAVSTSGVLAGKTITAVAAGDYFTMALDSAGKVYTWGNNGSGALGNNSATSSLVPVAVDTSGVLAGKTIIRIAAGADFALALSQDGRVFSWGANGNGQLGSGSASGGSVVPVAVSVAGVLAGQTVAAIAAGSQHAVVVGADGKLYSWGFNHVGQLGNGGVPTASTSPIAVTLSGAAAGKTFSAVAAGNYHSLALTTTGELFTWGDGSQSQLGHGSTTSSNVPVAVTMSGALAGQTVTLIGAGYNHCIVATSGTERAYTWGSNSNGALGTGGLSSNVPVAVDTAGALSGINISGLGTGSGATRSIVIGYPNPPLVTSLTPNPTVTVGTAVTLTATATGGTSYKWAKDGTDIPGANALTYTLANPALSDAGTYRFTAINAAGTHSLSTTLTVNPAPTPPVITTQPGPLTVNVGQTATFFVVATGTSPTYQWYRGSGAIPGATTAAYTIPVAALTDAGAYSVEVRNVLGGVSSNEALLTVNPAAPTLSIHPVSQTVTAGNNVTLSVTATGASLSYVWRHNGTLLNGETASSLTLANIDPQQAGNYTVRVSNAGGSVTSNAAVITVNPAAPVITSHPSNLTVNTGAPATFQATVNGTSLTFQWYKDGITIPGATSLVYGIPQAAAAAAGSYTLVAQNSTGSVTTNPATLTINDVPPVITTHPGSRTITVGTTTAMTVSATGASLTYLWRKAGVPINGANGATFTLTNATASDAGSYTVTVTNSGGSVTSNAALVTVNLAAPVIASHPTNQTATVGTGVTFNVSATGSTLGYQWQFGGTPIAGATTSTLTIPTVTLADAGSYAVTVFNSGGSVTSNAATLTLSSSLQPQSIQFAPIATYTLGDPPITLNATASSGLPITLSVVSGPATIDGNIVTLTGSGDVTIQALQSGNASYAPAAVTRAFTVNRQRVTVTLSDLTQTYDGRPKSPVVTTNPVGLPIALSFAGTSAVPVEPGNYAVTAQITNPNYTGNSSAQLTITVAAPVFTLQPTSQTVVAGTTVTLRSATRSLPGATYQWMVDGRAIPGATASTYTIESALPAHSADYTVVATNPGGSTTSKLAHVSVQADQRIANLSTRAQVGSGDRVAIAGFVIDGSAPRPILLRAAGPALADFGITGALARPSLTLYQGSTRLAQNTGWTTAENATELAATAADLGAFAFKAGSPDSALLVNLAPGAYTALVTGGEATTGQALVEVYDTAKSTPGLINIASRGTIDTAGQVLISGFTLTGVAPRRVLVRAVGPTLARFGVAGAIGDPQLKLYRGSTLVATNDDWADDTELANAAALNGAFALNAGSRDAALFASLESGGYTIVVNGSGTTTGVVLVEVYQLP